jgi:hypothetical protein
MILAVLIDGEGRPVCSEMWPGNTADVTTLIPVIDRLRQRFAIAPVCVIADRGMIKCIHVVPTRGNCVDVIARQAGSYRACFFPRGPAWPPHEIISTKEIFRYRLYQNRKCIRPVLFVIK